MGDTSETKTPCGTHEMRALRTADISAVYRFPTTLGGKIMFLAFKLSNLITVPFGWILAQL